MFLFFSSLNVGISFLSFVLDLMIKEIQDANAFSIRINSSYNFAHVFYSFIEIHMWSNLRILFLFHLLFVIPRLINEDESVQETIIYSTS